MTIRKTKAAEGVEAPPLTVATPPRFEIKDTMKDVPQRTLLVGLEGIGKSSFAAACPGVVFIVAEEGLQRIRAKAFPEPRTMDDVYAQIQFLRDSKHSFTALAIDTLDWLEPLLIERICKRNGWETLESPGYGKGHMVVPDEWRTLLARLDDLRRDRGMEIILLAHAKVSQFNNPTGDDFSRYTVQLHKHATPLVQQWVDCQLFATYETLTTDKKKGRVKGVSSGRRVIKTEWAAAWDAKNRYGLPPELPLDWDEFAKARVRGLDVDEEEIAAELNRLAIALKMDEDALAYIRGLAGQPHELVVALNRLRVRAADAGIIE